LEKVVETLNRENIIHSMVRCRRRKKSQRNRKIGLNVATLSKLSIEKGSRRTKTNLFNKLISSSLRYLQGIIGYSSI
jgi:hypothetical protein